MIFDPKLQFSYEEFGLGFPIFSFLYLLSPILVIITSIFTFRRLKGINKLRYKYIALGYLFYVFNSVFFLAFLPIFDIWIVQKEQIFAFIPFVVSIWYVSHRYKFFDFSLSLRRVVVFSFAAAFSICFVYVMRIYLSLVDEQIL
jgi:hypothetical protein